MKPFKIIIEMVTPESVNALKRENEELRHELKRMQAQHNGLHETVYRFMENFAEMKRSMKDRK